MKSAQQHSAELTDPELREQARLAAGRAYCALDDARAHVYMAQRALSQAPTDPKARGYIVAALVEQDMNPGGELARLIADLTGIEVELARWATAVQATPPTSQVATP